MEFLNLWSKQFAEGKDATFLILLISVFALFIVFEAVWRMRRLRQFKNDRLGGEIPHDDARLESIWTAVPLAVLLVLFLVHRPRPQPTQRQSIASDSIQKSVIKSTSFRERRY